jgi:WD40 repeat protein
VAEDAQDVAEKQTRLAEGREARLAVERGLLLCEQGDVRQGLLWLARGLELARCADLKDLENAVRINLADWLTQLGRPRYLLPHAERIRQARLNRRQGTVPVRSLAVSPRGDVAATGCEEGRVQLWDLATGRPLHAPLAQFFEPEVFSSPIVISLAFSADGKVLAAGTTRGEVRRWDVSTAKQVGTTTIHRWLVDVWGIAFSPDGQSFATAGGDGYVRRWRADTGRELKPALQCGRSAVYAVSFTPDGEVLLSGTRDGAIGFWDAHSGRPLDCARSPDGLVSSLAVSPDGRRLLVGGRSQAQLWELPGREPLLPLLRHTARVPGVAFSPDGQFCLTGDHDGWVQLWHVATCQPLGAALRHSDKVCGCFFGPDGLAVLAGYDGVGRVWELPAARCVGVALLHPRPVTRVAFSQDGRTLLTASEKGAWLRDGKTGQPRLGPLFPGRTAVRTAGLSPDGRWLSLSGWSGGSFEVQDASTGRSLFASPRHAWPVNGLVFSPDSRRLLSICEPWANDRSELRWWEMSSPPRPARRKGHYPPQTCCAAFHPNGRLLLLGCWDRKAWLWDAEAGRAVGEPLPHSEAVLCLAFSPDGRRALTGCRDGSVRLWDVGRRRQAGPPISHRGAVNSVAFSPDGQIGLTASADGTARFWDLKTGISLGPPLRHAGAVNQAAFHPDGRTMVTGGADGVAQRWRVPGQPRPGEPERIQAQVEALTGLALDEQGAVHVRDIRKGEG